MWGMAMLTTAVLRTLGDGAVETVSQRSVVVPRLPVIVWIQHLRIRLAIDAEHLTSINSCTGKEAL
jgi:hypothetical protein